MSGAAQTYLSNREHFVVSDARDAYERLGLLRAPDDVARWRAARADSLVRAPELVSAGDAGFAVVRSLDADSAAFQIPIWAVDALVVAGDDEVEQRRNARQLLDALREDMRTRATLVTLLVDLDRHLFLESLQDAGARVFGVNHTWTCPVDGLVPEFLPGLPGFHDDDVRPETTAELLAAVAAAYSTYRSHYNADSRIPAGPIADSYVATVARHVRAGGAVALVRTEDDSLVAFETVDPHVAVNDAIGRTAIGELATAGVVPQARRSGAFETSLAYGISRLRALGCTDIVYACTADNFAVQSTLIRVGKFRLRRVTLRLHWWLDQ